MESKIDPNIVQKKVKLSPANFLSPLVELGDKVITSRDKIAIDAMNNMASFGKIRGFHSWQLPFSFPDANCFITIGEPGLEVPQDLNFPANQLKVVLRGSISYEGMDLISGEWIYIPNGRNCDFKAGLEGVVVIFTLISDPYGS